MPPITGFENVILPEDESELTVLQANESWGAIEVEYYPDLLCQQPLERVEVFVPKTTVDPTVLARRAVMEAVAPEGSMWRTVRELEGFPIPPETILQNPGRLRGISRWFRGAA